MSNHFDNVVHNADMDSSEFDEDSNTEEEHTTRTVRPTHRRSPIEEATHPRTKRPAPSTPMPLQVWPVPTPNNAANQNRPRNSVILDRLEGIQKWVVVILVVALGASLCHSLAFTSGSWMQNGSTHIGLWMDCNCTAYTPGGGIMLLIDLVVFGVQPGMNLSYSFYAAILSAICSLAIGATGVIRKLPSDK